MSDQVGWEAHLGLVYVLHLDRPVDGRQHQAGWTTVGRLKARMREHRTGKGSPCTEAARRDGVGFHLALTIHGADRALEEILHKQDHGAAICPVCRQAGGITYYPAYTRPAPRNPGFTPLSFETPASRKNLERETDGPGGDRPPT